MAAVLRNTGPGGANVIALDAICKLAGIQDQPGLALLQGLPLVGEVETITGHSTSAEPTAAATISVETLANIDTAQDPRVRAALGGPSPAARQPDVAEAIWESTKAEIGLHLLDDPVDFSECQQRRGPLTVRFGVKQLSSSGKEKVRAIDDFLASSVNAATTINLKLHHDSVDDIIEATRQLHRPDDPPRLTKADFKGAYRTVPLHPDQRHLAAILVYDTDRRRWVRTRQRACPFGALSSVYHWDRIAAAMTSIARWMGLPIFRYVDDLFMSAPSSIAEDFKHALTEVIAALGWCLEPSKTEGPLPQLTILGLLITINDDDFTVHITPDPRKAPMWISHIEQLLHDRSCPPSDAEKLAGRLNFAGSSVYGKCGRDYLRALYRRQHERTTDINPALQEALEWWVDFLRSENLHRIVPMTNDSTPPVLVYTDAEGKGGIGASIYDHLGNLLLWSASTIPPSYDDLLQPRQTQINGYEILAAVWGAHIAHRHFPSRPMRLFIDNSAAENILRSGSSRSTDLSRLAGGFWIWTAVNDIVTYIHRVPSKSNPADGPSRGGRPPGARIPATSCPLPSPKLLVHSRQPTLM